MAGTVTLAPTGADGVATLTLAHPGKLNAIDIAMWRELRALFERLQALPPGEAPRAVIVRGADGQFASGGDIAEFAGFRFDAARLRDFHEHVVAPALHAMLDCELPLVAQIEGHCLGGGFEIAACCDIRVCGDGSRFGAPIARLGFPMAPLELQVVARVASGPVLREMLLEARLLGAAAALQHGLVHAAVPDDEVAAVAVQRARQIAQLAPQALRLNKRTLRQLERDGPTEAERLAHYAYADSEEHREGIAAFLEKRTPRFGRA
ncbi:MAG: enoyl-CoA hydratase/isomerase family protein [Piscinibacter sp.]|uniref:enoyl-CoA hydratase/isomerase family protein n=1 Tax=Piscinibacter TaxID=1114981 RepID=UPI000FDF3BA5|nr:MULTISPECIES: enoyl-CoA hydratase-related protein [Piscinibacter]MCW5665714.1 enoyl-CoA hydratase/isomerase family protein [Piscinibacter sp.]